VIVTGVNDSYTGTVVWIASEAEFTPKTILTRETRDTLVYEVKIRVHNPLGELKIGMPVDVIL
jgi:HlyD family secretion protein